MNILTYTILCYILCYIYLHRSKEQGLDALATVYVLFSYTFIAQLANQPAAHEDAIGISQQHMKTP